MIFFDPQMMLSHNHAARRICLSIGLFAFILWLSSCMKEEKFSDIPQIAFENFTLEFDTGIYATRGYLTISFRDGDGDIGLLPNETDSPYTYNYYIDYFVFYNDSSFVRFDTLTNDKNFSLNARIPLLTPDNPNKAIKGIIVDTLLMDELNRYDTVKYKFYILDRKLHRSNTDSTPPIILRRR